MKNKNFDLNMHTARLLLQEPFFAALSRRIDKTASTALPTAGVHFNEHRQQFELLYNPDFFAQLSEQHKLGVLMHEFYHIIFEHVLLRKPEGGIQKIDNIAMDLAINGLPEMRNKIPGESCPGPVLPGSSEPMKGCIPGEGMFADFPSEKSYEYYKQMLEEKFEQDPNSGGGDGGGDGLGDVDSMDSHEGFGQASGTDAAVAAERLKQAVRDAAEEASKSNNWGSVSASMRKRIMDSIATHIDWRSVLRYFVKTSQRADKRSTPRRINRRFPKIHPGKRVRRHAKIAISIDQSGSVSDAMLAAFFSELNNLATIAEFTVIPFDTEVAEDKVYTWKRGESRVWERVLTGGTCFNAPTNYVNERNFDGHIILTDMMAPKPVASRCQRMWLTDQNGASRPYFQTNERVIAIN